MDCSKYVPMNSKIILGISIATLFAIFLMSSPLVAEAITDLVKTNVLVKNNEYKKIDFWLANKVPKDGSVFVVYAIFTDE